MLRIETGSLRGKTLETVPDPRTRYTTALVRQSLSNMVDFSDLICADLFCGSGVVGFEMLSNGARHVTFVDASPLAISTVKKNAERLGLSDKVTVVRMDVRRFVETCSERFDLVFADPPYDLGLVGELVRLVPRIMMPTSYFILQCSKREKLSLSGTEGLEIVKEKAYGDTFIFFLQKI